MAVERSRAGSPGLPVLIALLAYGWVTQAWAPVLVLIAAALGALLVKNGWHAGRGTQFATAAGAALIGSALVSPLPELHQQQPLPVMAARLALSVLVLTVARLYLRAPIGGHAITLSLGLLAMMAVGMSRPNAAYAGFTAAFVAASVSSLRQIQLARADWTQLDGKRRLATVAAVVTATSLGLALAIAVPPVHDSLVRVLLRIGRHTSISSFSDQIRLGSSSDIRQSDGMVMRLRGPRVDYLRGTAFRTYQDGEWTHSGEEGRPVEMTGATESTHGRVEIRSARSSSRYFLPMNARSIGTPTRKALATRSGVVVAPPGASADVVWFEPGGRDDQVPVAGPEDLDVDVPDGMRDKLSGVATSWTHNARGSHDKLRALQARLIAGYAYSLRHDTTPGSEPTLDFLFVHRSGHCEYFASAMALLARSLGIPARVVGGYRVTEYNRLGDYYVVRDRNAHAWVEAWVPGQGWMSFDPTPPSGPQAAAAADSPLMGAMLDLVWSGWLLGWTPKARALHLSIALGLLGLFIAAPRLIQRLRRPAKRPPAAGLPSAAFRRLEQYLERAGERRGPAEPLEHWAGRLRNCTALSPRRAHSAARIVEAYARYRYGDLGTLAEIEAAVADYLDAPASRPSLSVLVPSHAGKRE